MHNILIVEDHKIVANGIKALLLGSMYKVIGICDDEASLFKTLDNNSIDIILLDIRLNGISGIYLAKQIKKEYPTIKIVALSSSTDDPTLVACIKIGVNGFVSKTSSDEELVTALNAVTNNENYYSKDIKLNIDDILDKKEEDPNFFKNNILSDREIEIIRLFAEGMSYKEIASHLNISTSTVDSHKYKIQEKLSVTTTLDIVKYAIKNNLIEL